MFVSWIQEYAGQLPKRLPAFSQLLSAFGVDQRDKLLLYPIKKHTTKFRDTSLDAVDITIFANILNAAAGVQDHRASAGLQQQQRLQPAMCGVWKSQDVLIEHAIDINKEE